MSAWKSFFLVFVVALYSGLGTVSSGKAVLAQTPSTKNGSTIEELETEYVRLYKQGDYDRALLLARKALELQEKQLGPEHLSVSDTLTNIATILIATGQSAKADSMLRRVVEIREKALGLSHPETIQSLERYVCLLWSIGKQKEAGEVEDKIKKIRNSDVTNTELENLIRGRATRRVQPRYPEEMRRARIGAVVVVHIVVDEAGNVTEAIGRCGDEIFVESAVEAARLWKFKPWFLDGKPVKVSGRLVFTFVP